MNKTGWNKTIITKSQINTGLRLSSEGNMSTILNYQSSKTQINKKVN